VKSSNLRGSVLSSSIGRKEENRASSTARSGSCACGADGAGCWLQAQFENASSSHKRRKRGTYISVVACRRPKSPNEGPSQRSRGADVRPMRLSSAGPRLRRGVWDCGRCGNHHPEAAVLPPGLEDGKAPKRRDHALEPIPLPLKRTLDKNSMLRRLA
jgi:hypothetical protein